MRDVERRHIQYVLAVTDGRIRGKRGAAELLGLKPSTLYSRMKKLSIRQDAYPSHNSPTESAEEGNSGTSYIFRSRLPASHDGLAVCHSITGVLQTASA